jgi:hypothetical protein
MSTTTTEKPSFFATIRTENFNRHCKGIKKVAVLYRTKSKFSRKRAGDGTEALIFPAMTLNSLRSFYRRPKRADVSIENI